MDAFQELIGAVSDTCNVTRINQILDDGFDVNHQNSQGCTALMFAVMPSEFGDDNTPTAIMRVVRSLLERGADTALLDEAGMSAHDYCCQHLDPEFRDDFGDCPLGKWSSEDIEMIKRILELLSPSD